MWQVVSEWVQPYAGQHVPPASSDLHPPCEPQVPLHCPRLCCCRVIIVAVARTPWSPLDASHSRKLAQLNGAQVHGGSRIFR